MVFEFINFLKEEVLKFKIGDFLLFDMDVGCVVDVYVVEWVMSWIGEVV